MQNKFYFLLWFGYLRINNLKYPLVMRKKAHQLLKELALFSLASAATVFRVFPL
jgi:hypothetical protein